MAWAVIPWDMCRIRRHFLHNYTLLLALDTTITYTLTLLSPTNLIINTLDGGDGRYGSINGRMTWRTFFLSLFMTSW